MNELVEDFKKNISAGLKLALFRPCELDGFRFNLNQAMLLLAFDLLLKISLEWLFNPTPDFNTHALSYYALDLNCFLIAAYSISLMTRCEKAFLRVIITVCSVDLLMTLPDTILANMNDTVTDVITMLLMFAWLIYSVIVLYRTVCLTTGWRKLTAIGGAALFVTAATFPLMVLDDDSHFWSGGNSHQTEMPPQIFCPEKSPPLNSYWVSNAEP